MNPVDRPFHSNSTIYRRQDTQTNQAEEHVPPASAPTRLGNASSIPVSQDAHPPRADSQRIVYTVDRVEALGRSGQSVTADEDAKILSAFDRYEAGESMDVLKRDIPSICSYLAYDGLAKTAAAKLFVERLNTQQRSRVQTAIEKRQQILQRQSLFRQISHRFITISDAYADPALSMKEVAQRAKVKEEDLRQFLTESGLTELGREVISRHKESARRSIEYNFSLRQERIAGKSDQASVSSPQRQSVSKQLQENRSDSSIQSASKERKALGQHSPGESSSSRSNYWWPQSTWLPIEASADIARHTGRKLFVSGIWLSATVAGLDEGDRRLLGSLVDHFKSGKTASPDLNGPVELADDASDKVHLIFDSDDQRGCKAICSLDEQDEVFRIEIHAPNRAGNLVLTKPVSRTTNAAPKRAAPLSEDAQQPPQHNAIPLQKKIKTEPETLASFPSNFPAPVKEVEIERINTVQALHTPVTLYPMVDLTMEQEPDIGVMDLYRVHHTNDASLVTGKQNYDPKLDWVFPIRDPANPTRVHPDYADPVDPARCATSVGLNSVQFFKGGTKKTKWGTRLPVTEMTEDRLWRMLKTHFPNDHLYNNGADKDMKEVFIESLKRACRQELEACIKGEAPPSSENVKVVPVTAEQCDNPDEARALAGQYGGVLTSYDKNKQPNLRNGRIVCLFAGARLETDEERDAYFGTLGPELAKQAQLHYSVGVKKYGTKKKRVDWAPYGGGNMGQYFNSSFKPDGKVDPAQCNACFMPVTFELTTRDGSKRRETMMAVIQYREIEKGKQIKLDYGDEYRLHPSEAQSMQSGMA